MKEESQFQSIVVLLVRDILVVEWKRVPLKIELKSEKAADHDICKL